METSTVIIVKLLLSLVLLFDFLISLFQSLHLSFLLCFLLDVDSNRDRDLEEDLVNRALDLRAEGSGSGSLVPLGEIQESESSEVSQANLVNHFI